MLSRGTLFFIWAVTLFSCVQGYSGLSGSSKQQEVFAGEATRDEAYMRIKLHSPDDSLRATFVPHGATMLDFWTRDRYGEWRDIVAGYDDATLLGTDPLHPFFGPQVGRYANRIKNGTFIIDGKTYHTPLNEKGKNDTVHGGHGFDNRTYTVSRRNSSSVLFTYLDPDGNQGFPGSVLASAEYSLKDNGHFHIEMNAEVVKGKTPIMLSHHVYWALHGFDKTHSILNHTLHMPRADKYIPTDSTLIPTGKISSVKGTPFDFTKARKFADRFSQTVGICGEVCQGWDSCFVMSEHDRDDTILSLTSPESGIQMQVKTNQDAVQVYTGSGLSTSKGSIPRKKSQGGDGTLDHIYENYSCVVIEMEDYSEWHFSPKVVVSLTDSALEVDGINHPEWGRDQIYDPTRPYKWAAEYSFSTVD
jgi:aldose 1-epimerase